MSTKVLIVDDSVVFRSQIKAAVSGIEGLEVVGSAANGKIALAKLTQTPVDLVTLDIEMPEMNGLETLKEIRRQGFKTRVIVFSSMTMKGAAAALEALRNGADDVVGKPTGDGASLEGAASAIGEQLVPRIRQFMNKEPNSATAPTSVPHSTLSDQSAPQYSRVSLSEFRPKIILIGSSTGGPRALEEIFQRVRPPLEIPILIVQHMPPVFTKYLADRIHEISGLPAKEASQMEILENKVYVAPGNYHMSLIDQGGKVHVRLDQGPPQNMVRPAVDPLFESATKLFSSGCMGFVLTGMGEDGMRGTRALKASGGRVMIQNKESCVVFGMPGAVFREGSYDQIGNLDEITRTLQKMIRAKSA